MMEELRSGENPVNKAAQDRAEWPDDWDKRDQVAAVADMLTEARSVDWVADEADVDPETARTHLNRFVNDGTLTAVTTDDGTTRYKPDPEALVSKKVRELRDRGRAELTEELEHLADEIETWQSEYNVESPDELRTTIDDGLSAGEQQQRRRDAYDWERNEEVRRLINLALQHPEEQPSDER